MKKPFILACLIFSINILYAEDLPVNLEYPSFKGDFYASGRITLPPGKAPTGKNIAIKNGSTWEEVPSLITIRKKWPDGSVMSADIIFPANAEERADYKISFGGDVEGKSRFSEPAVLPTVTFSIAGSPKSAETMDMAVGQINVRVDKSSNIYYYWHIVPITILTLIVLYRTNRARKKRFYEI